MHPTTFLLVALMAGLALSASAADALRAGLYHLEVASGLLAEAAHRLAAEAKREPWPGAEGGQGE